MMAQHKIPELKATMLYHHHHENHNVWDPKSQISIPGTKFSFVELAKLTKDFKDLKTERDFLFYFLKRVDNLSMPQKEVDFYLKRGGILATVLERAKEISASKKHQDFMFNLENIRANYDIARKRDADDITRGDEERGELRGWGKGWSKGQAEGMAKGKAEAQTEMAQKLIADGFKHDRIAQLTGLSAGEVKEISLAHNADHS